MLQFIEQWQLQIGVLSLGLSFYFDSRTIFSSNIVYYLA